MSRYIASYVPRKAKTTYNLEGGSIQKKYYETSIQISRELHVTPHFPYEDAHEKIHNISFVKLLVEYLK
jgi:hypothetical protein